MEGIVFIGYILLKVPRAIWHGQYALGGYVVDGWPAQLIGFLLLQAAAQLGMLFAVHSLFQGAFVWPAWYLDTAKVSVVAGVAGPALLAVIFRKQIDTTKTGEIGSDRGPVTRTRQHIGR